MNKNKGLYLNREEALVVINALRHQGFCSRKYEHLELFRKSFEFVTELKKRLDE